MDRNTLLATAGETIAYAEDYIETRIDMVKLEVADKGTRVAAQTITYVICATLGLFALSALSIALAFWLGALLDSVALGFLIVGLIYLVIAAIVFALRETLLEKPILHALIANLFKYPKHDEQSH